MLNTAHATPKTDKCNKIHNVIIELINVTELRAGSTLKNTVKPWSALYGRVTRGSQLSPSAHKDLPLPVTTPLTR